MPIRVPEWIKRRRQKRKPANVSNTTGKPKPKNAGKRPYKPYTKRPTRAQLQQFWKEYDKGKRRSTKGARFDLSDIKLWKREPVIVTPTLLGTVREFNHVANLRDFVERVRRVNQIGQEIPFEHFDFQPLEIFDIDEKKLRLVERVYLAPSIYRIRTHTENASRYGKMFLRRMQEKGVDLSELREVLYAASQEIYAKIQRRIAFDADQSNLLVLDYNPETKKPLIVIIDHGLSKHV